MDPDRAGAIRQLLLPLGLGTALSLLGDSTLYTVLPEPAIHAQWGLSLATVGLVLGLNRLVRLGFNGAAGLLFDRFSGKRLLLLSMALGTAANASYALTMDLTWILVGRILWGAAWAGIWVGGHALLLAATHADDRGRLSGRYQLWFFAGVGTMSFAGGALTDLIGFRATLWLAAGSCALAFLIWALFLPDPAAEASEVAPEEPSPSPASGGFPWRPSLAAALPYFSIRLILPGVLASTTIVWLRGYFGGGLQAGPWTLPLASLTGGFVAVRTLAGMVGAPLSGWLSDRLRRRWGVMAGVLVAGALGLALMTSQWVVAALGGSLLAATIGPGIQALSPAVVGDRVSFRRRGRGLGLVFTLGDLGSALGPPLALGLLAQVSIEAVYGGCALLLLLTALFAGAQAVRETPFAIDD